MSDNIPVPTLKQLLKELEKVGKWFVFGIYLDVPVDQLEKIESSHQQKDLERCKIDMLQYWLDNNVNASWKNVVRALEQTNQLVLAETVKHKYLLSTIADQGSIEQVKVNATSSALPSTSPLPTPSLPAVAAATTANIGAEIKAGVAVVEELQRLENSYSHTLVKVVRFLKTNCDLSEAQLFLDVATGTEEFSCCDNFDKLIRQLQRDQIDVFNISRLKELVACFNKDELIELVELYEEKKESFLKNITVIDFQCAVVSRVKPDLHIGEVAVTIKIPKKMASCRTLKDIEELAMEGFEECYKCLVRLHAEAGSIIISWVFPEALSDKLEQLTCKNAAIFKDAGVEEVTVSGRRVYPVTQQEDITTLTHKQDVSEKVKSTVKQVYTEFYHQLVDAVSDPLTCQSLTAQLHSTTLISQEKIAQLSSDQTSGSEFLKVLGVEEKPHLLTVLMDKMAGVKQLQTLAEQMTARLSELRQEAEYTLQQKTTERLKAKIDKLTSENKNLLMQLEKEREEANKLFLKDSLSVRLMVSKTKKEMEMQERISELERKLQSYSVADVQRIYKKDSVIDEEKEVVTLPHHEGYSDTAVQTEEELGPLPVSWESHEGHVFIDNRGHTDHNTQSTQWEDPRTIELHQTLIQELFIFLSKLQQLWLKYEMNAIQQEQAVFEKKLHLAKPVLPEFAANLAKHPLSAVIHQYRQYGGDDDELIQVLSDMKLTTCSRPDVSQPISDASQLSTAALTPPTASQTSSQDTTRMDRFSLSGTETARSSRQSASSDAATHQLKPLNRPPEYLDLLIKVAARARDKWRKMGLQLNIPMDQFNSMTATDPISCYTDVFNWWQRNGSPPYTWATIIDALRAPMVGEVQLAHELEEWLTTVQAPVAAMPTSTASTATASSTPGVHGSTTDTLTASNIPELNSTTDRSCSGQDTSTTSGTGVVSSTTSGEGSLRGAVQPAGPTPQPPTTSDSQAQGKRRPTLRDLLVVRKKDGSRLKIIFEITSHGATASRDLATLLLGDDSVVRKLHLECKDDNDAFVRKVFDTWLNQDDDDSTRSTTPCTWEELCQCVEDTDGLPGSLAKEIRNRFCS